MFARNCWYVAGWSHGLESGGVVLARKILNTLAMLWKKLADFHGTTVNAVGASK